ncbi:MAG: TetR/AcrR family transcriptional regulator [bacterium]
METVLLVADDIDERILRAAEVEFAEKGFYGAVVSDIADRADVGKGTVYRHFGSKEELFARIVENGVDDLLQGIEKNTRRLDDVEEKLKVVVAVHADMFKRSRHLVKIITHEGYGMMLEGKTDARRLFEKLIYSVAEIIEEGIETGQFKNVDIYRAARIYLGQLTSIVKAAILFDEDNCSIDKDCSLFYQIFIDGLRGNGGKNIFLRSGSKNEPV